MELKGYSHIVDLFHRYNKKGLTEDEVKKIVTDTLALPWVQQLNVFSEQCIFLLDLYTFNYLYVSPSVKGITGYELSYFATPNSLISLMSPEEADVLFKVSNLTLSKFLELKLGPAEKLNFRVTWNNWFKRKDGNSINILQQNMALLLNSEGVPLLQMTIVTDITALNDKLEHFYNAVVVNDDGTEQTVFSGRVENTDELISARELDILRLVSHGKSSESIAKQLKISVETVKSHSKNLLTKTNAKDTIDLVRVSYANGWL